MQGELHDPFLLVGSLKPNKMLEETLASVFTVVASVSRHPGDDYLKDLLQQKDVKKDLLHCICLK